MTTTKTQHTQGEWNVTEEAAFPYIFTVGTKGFRIATLRADYHKTKEEAEANAKLISAAPDLLEALQEIVRLFPFLTLSQMHRDSLENAKAAIAKATT